MGVTKKIVTKGNGVDKPKKGDEVSIEYTGNLYDQSKGEQNDFRGKEYVAEAVSTHEAISLTNCSTTSRFDSSKGRGDFRTQIGVGKVIKGTTIIQRPGRWLLVDMYKVGTRALRK
ncbi:hypothetical protein MMC28_006145 [Mycoblastus sanguinarius]|nr:hypothetical protein [Mycoblastus sanguinarius]